MTPSHSLEHAIALLPGSWQGYHEMSLALLGSVITRPHSVTSRMHVAWLRRAIFFSLVDGRYLRRLEQWFSGRYRIRSLSERGPERREGCRGTETAGQTAGGMVELGHK